METLKTVVGYDGFYEVSDLGNVYGIERKIWKSDRNMKKGGCWITRKAGPACITDHTPRKGAWVGQFAYKEARLCREGKVRCHLVHRLVWEAFNGSIPEGYHVDHMDNNPSNNRLDNLQCLSPRAHKRVTLERTHDVKILDEYWDMEDVNLKMRGMAVHLSRAYWKGMAEAQGP